MILVPTSSKITKIRIIYNGFVTKMLFSFCKLINLEDFNNSGSLLQPGSVKTLFLTLLSKSVCDVGFAACQHRTQITLMTQQCQQRKH